jgi:catechol 2,3-dioxygenase-like lactoylglutathione lyase family enzyme
VIAGIDHVQVAAPPGCEEQARAFYGGLLELPEVAKPEALAGRLAAAGHAVTWDESLPGEERFYVADPFGNRLELLASPARL